MVDRCTVNIAYTAEVVVHDPRANAKAAEHSPGLAYAVSPEAAVRNADPVLHLTDWPEFAGLDPQALLPLVKHARIVDGRDRLDADRWRRAGWRYRAMGRPGQPLT